MVFIECFKGKEIEQEGKHYFQKSYCTIKKKAPLTRGFFVLIN